MITILITKKNKDFKKKDKANNISKEIKKEKECYENNKTNKKLKIKKENYFMKKNI